MNKVILVGRLTADPELRQTQSGISTCRFTVAVDRKFANKETGKKESDFITCVAWRQTSDFISKFFTKGKMICIEGEMRNNNYKDKNHEDVMHYTMEVYVDNVEFCGSKSDGTAATPAPNSQQTNNLEGSEDIAAADDTPF